MVTIEPVTGGSDPILLESVRALFRAYGEFLRSTGGHEEFHFDRLQQEILELPASYTANNGEVLAAIELSCVAGCIAYRAVSLRTDPSVCELKRLFVAPEFRSRSIGTRLVAGALERARSKHFQFACLDTEPRSMPAAHRTYLNLGFVECEPPNAYSGSAVVYLRKALV